MSYQISTGVERITPELATKMLAQNLNNRPLKKKRVEFYANQMAKGQWKLNGETIVFASNGELVNGQHRLQAIIQSNTPIESVVVRGVDPSCFSTYDSGTNRSSSDVFAICDILNASNVSSVVRKYNLLMNNSVADMAYNQSADKIKLTNQDLLDMYETSPLEFQEFTNYAACLIKNMKLFLRTEIAATMMYLYTDKGHDKLTIYKFFDMLFSYRVYDDIKEKNVSKLLRERIIKSTLRQEKINPLYKTKLLMKAWNYYIEDKDAKVLRVEENEIIDYI